MSVTGNRTTLMVCSITMRMSEVVRTLELKAMHTAGTRLKYGTGVTYL